MTDHVKCEKCGVAVRQGGWLCSPCMVEWLVFAENNKSYTELYAKWIADSQISSLVDGAF